MKTKKVAAPWQPVAERPLQLRRHLLVFAVSFVKKFRFPCLQVWPAGVMAAAGALNVVYQGMKTREWLA